MIKTINCKLDNQGVLYPDETGRVQVTLQRYPAVNDDPPTGTVSWCGKIQGYVTFDINGQAPVGIHITDMSLNAHITQRSVENLLPFF